MLLKTKIICLAVISILVFTSISTATLWPSSTTPNLEDQSNISNSFIESLLEDPFLDQEPEVIVNGTSGEFSSNYHSSSGSTDISYIEIEWTHTENTELDFRGVDPEGIMTDYNDFIYTYQEFEFPYETRPSDAQISFNYSVYLTGDFAPGVQEFNNLMFRVYVWVIDSSGNWYRVYESREAVYTEEYQQKYLNLNYFNLVDIFNGMIEVEGVQEDPTDTAILAIGLAPAYRFESFSGTEPWTFYDGSVSLRVSYADMYIVMDIPNDPSTSWQPEYNETYGTTVGDVFPLYENASDGVLDECYGMKIGSDGSVYVTGNTRTSYELFLQGYRFRHQFLLKYNPSLDLLWEVKNDNMTQVKSMYVQGGYIYTTGYIDRDDTGRNLIVTKWSSSGERVWQTEWGGEFSQTGVAVGVQSNGSIYVVCSDYNMDDPGWYQKTGILTFDNNGNLLWNRTCLYFLTMYDAAGDLYIFDDFFEFRQRVGNVIGGRYYFNGTENYASGGDVIVPDEEGGYYAASYSGMPSEEEEGTKIFLWHFSSEGDLVWYTSYSKVWPNGWSYSLIPREIVITPDDKIQLLAQHTTFSNEYLLLTYDLEGNLLENRTIGDENWPYDSAPIFMAVGNSGLVYFAFTIYGYYLENYEICVQAYKMYEIGGQFNLGVTTVIIIASTIVILGAVSAIVRAKRRK